MHAKSACSDVLQREFVGDMRLRIRWYAAFSSNGCAKSARRLGTPFVAPPAASLADRRNSLAQFDKCQTAPEASPASLALARKMDCSSRLMAAG